MPHVLLWLLWAPFVAHAQDAVPTDPEEAPVDVSEADAMAVEEAVDPEDAGRTRPRDRSRLAKRLPRAEHGLRTMKYHPFIPPQGFDDAFVTSHFGLETGASFLSLPQVVTEEGEDPYDLLLVGALEELSVGAQFIEWLMLYGTATGNLVVGINEPSALDQGAKAGAVWDVGLAGKLFRIKKTGTQLSLRAKFVGGEGIRLRPESVLEGLERRNDGSIENLTAEELATLLLNEGSLGGGGSVNLGQAFGAWGSLQASVEARFGTRRFDVIDASDENDVRKATLWAGTSQLLAGAAFTVDGWPFFPVGLQLEYGFDWSRTSYVEGPRDVLSHQVGGGLFYTGHPDFVIGVRGSVLVASNLATQPVSAGAGILFRVNL